MTELVFGDVFVHVPRVVQINRAAPRQMLRILVTYLPGGIDRFFAEIGEVAPTREVPPPPQAPAGPGAHRRHRRAVRHADPGPAGALTNK